MTPQFKQGDMWSALKTADLFCITTNAQTNKDSSLVMGRGIALQAKERYPRLPYIAGRQLERRQENGTRYGLLLVDVPRESCPFGLFQVKLHWKDQADLGLIDYSARRLASYCAWFESGLTGWGFSPEVHLNFPGIGNGRLGREAVLPLLDRLPPNVTIWEQPS